MPETAADPLSPYPAPIPTPETEHFWQAARQGQLLVPCCQQCGKHFWYPRRICPFCLSDQVQWQVSPGTGRVYTYTVVRHATPLFVLAYVTLDEGPCLLTHLVEKDPDTWTIGDAVRVRFAASEGEYPIPVFGPDEAKRAIQSGCHD